MASWNFTTSGAAKTKAGANANSTVTASEGILAQWSDDVEGTINARTRVDWITNPPSTNTAGILSDVASSMIAMLIINYDMGDYNSSTEAQTMLDVLDNDIDKKINDLKTKTIQEKM